MRVGHGPDCDSPTLADNSEAEQDMDIELGPITIQEVKEAIKKLKNGKAPGDDNVHADMLKTEQETPQLLQRIPKGIWDKEVIPDAWKRSTIIKLPKKWNLFDSNNWRGTTLLSITSKDCCRIILQHITTAVDKLLCQQQAGFRKGKSCIKHILVLCQILEQSHEWNSSLYMVHVDIERAVDSLH